MSCMFRENTAKKQGNISNSSIERRTHLRVNDASQLDHVIQVDVAEASFMPSAALLPVNDSVVCAGDVFDAFMTVLCVKALDKLGEIRAFQRSLFRSEV